MTIFSKLRYLLFVFLALFCPDIISNAQSAEEGGKLFKATCASCHAINEKLVGPALKNAHTRYDEAWLLKWIKNSQELVQSGDPKAVKIFEESNKIVMPAFSGFTDDQVRSILAFVKTESEKAPAMANKAAGSAVVEPAVNEPVSSTDIWLLLFVVALLIAVAKNMYRIIQLMGELNGFPIITWNTFNAFLLIIFLLAGLAACFWEFSVHAPLTVNAQPAASAHGAIYDDMFIITLALTGIVFIITQILLFWYSFRYKHNAARKALYYPDNHKLELLWTVVPAIVLTVLVVRGLQTWSSITDRKQAEKAQPIEVFGQQFSWIIRYPGADNRLGPHDFRQIGKTNALGVDTLAQTSKDDIIASELHLKTGVPVVLNFRSKDVIHSAYLPHFRVQMNVVPGLPTQFTFTPTVTTSDMRKKLNNPEFNYVLLCNKICGTAHYRMNSLVVVESAGEYDKWMSDQSKLVPAAQAAEPKIQPAALNSLAEKK